MKVHYFDGLSGFTLCNRPTRASTRGTFTIRRCTCAQCRVMYRRRQAAQRRRRRNV